MGGGRWAPPNKSAAAQKVRSPRSCGGGPRRQSGRAMPSLVVLPSLRELCFQRVRLIRAGGAHGCESARLQAGQRTSVQRSASLRPLRWWHVWASPPSPGPCRASVRPFGFGLSEGGARPDRPRVCFSAPLAKGGRGRGHMWRFIRASRESSSAAPLVTVVHLGGNEDGQRGQLTETAALGHGAQAWGSAPRGSARDWRKCARQVGSAELRRMGKLPTRGLAGYPQRMGGELRGPPAYATRPPANSPPRQVEDASCRLDGPSAGPSLGGGVASMWGARGEHVRPAGGLSACGGPAGWPLPDVVRTCVCMRGLLAAPRKFHHVLHRNFPQGYLRAVPRDSGFVASVRVQASPWVTTEICRPLGCPSARDGPIRDIGPAISRRQPTS